MINLIELKKLSFVAHQKLEDIMLSGFQSSELSQSRMISNTKKISFIPYLGSDPKFFERFLRDKYLECLNLDECTYSKDTILKNIE